MVDEPQEDGEPEVRDADGRFEHPAVRHERTDANARAILLILLGGSCLGVVILVGLMQYFLWYERHEDRVKRSPYPLAPAPSDAPPPQPRLEQINRVEQVEKSDVYKREESKEAILNSYGPTTEEGYVHIPISRAMALLENKLPVRPGSGAGQQKREDGLIDAGESNSGRTYRGKPRWYER